MTAPGKSKKSRVNPFRCQSCGAVHNRWLGRCNDCGEWNTLVEEVESAEASAGPAGRWNIASSAQSAGYVELSELQKKGSDSSSVSLTERYLCGITELDRVLGGGLMPDSFTLLGGDPGIGKSTLMLQMAAALARQGLKILYVSGEESVEQIASRARRLAVESGKGFYLESQNRLESVLASVQELQPQVLLIDSLQVFSTDLLQSSPGSVSQVREVAANLMSLAKSRRIAVILIGHVTKEGAIAGPKVVEHMVDTVLYFEGDAGRNFRLLRAVKNRFGSVNELGIFEMTGEGLQEMLNPSELFLSDRSKPVSGTAVTCTLEGSRPLLVEMQALCTDSPLAMPRRTASGMEGTRIALLTAIAERHLGLSLAESDLFFNVAGGLKVSEPACDLAALAAIWSAHCQIPIPQGWVFVGELGLTGEVRQIPQLPIRIQEAAKLGFHTVVLPQVPKKTSDLDNRVKLLAIRHVRDFPALFT